MTHKHSVQPCGGECCGTTHVQRWLWDASPKYVERATYARALLWLIADHLEDYFTRFEVHKLAHGTLYRRMERQGVEPWRWHDQCPTCQWDAYVVDYLHTNGYIGLLKLHPGGGRSGRYFLTDMAIDWLRSEGWRPMLRNVAA